MTKFAPKEANLRAVPSPMPELEPYIRIQCRRKYFEIVLK
jgi:hypothetical protein